MTTLKKTPLTRLGRLPKRGSYDRDVINAILDATPLCHVGHLIEGRPVVTPTCHWRVDDAVYWHGSRRSRGLLAAENNDVCLTVTHLDGLVLARSGFHHSANYRSVMVFGQPQIVDDKAAKHEALEHFIEGLFPGRWDTLRPPSRKEMNATTVLRLPIEEASAKVRTGPPSDLEEDESLPIWAGVIPLAPAAGALIPCEHNAPELPVPDHVTGYGESLPRP